MNDITLLRLKCVLEYNPETGRFIWIKPSYKNKNGNVGKVAGYLDQDGYVRITIDRRRYYAHRLAWLYMTGSWPEKQIDHKNRMESDNSWLNLRLATHAQNQHNRGVLKNNKTGLPGVVERKWGWVAYIMREGVNNYLGSFKDPDEAYGAYLKEREYRGEFNPK